MSQSATVKSPSPPEPPILIVVGQLSLWWIYATLYQNFTATIQAIKKAVVLSVELIFICLLGILLTIFLLLYYISERALKSLGKS